MDVLFKQRLNKCIEFAITDVVCLESVQWSNKVWQEVSVIFVYLVVINAAIQHRVIENNEFHGLKTRNSLDSKGVDCQVAGA